MKGGEILREILRTDLIQAERSEQDANREHLLRAQDSVDCDTVWLDTLQATRILTLAWNNVSASPKSSKRFGIRTFCANSSMCFRTSWLQAG